MKIGFKYYCQSLGKKNKKQKSDYQTHRICVRPVHESWKFMHEKVITIWGKTQKEKKVAFLGELWLNY